MNKAKQLLDLLDDIEFQGQDFELLDVSGVTYELYCKAIDQVILGTLDEGLFDSLKNMSLSKSLVKVFKDLKSSLQELAKQFKLGLKDIVKAFKQKDIFKLLKAVGFNIKVLFKSLGALSNAVRGGLFAAFHELAQSGVMKKIHSGATKVDEILDKYPILKKVGGLVVAGILLYIWLNMTFIGDLDYDFNFGDMAAALKGSFSVADLFASPQGLMLITLFGTGSMLGLSVPWLGKSMYNLVLAITYTGFTKLKDPAVQTKARDIHKKMKTFKLK